MCILASIATPYPTNNTKSSLNPRKYWNSIHSMIPLKSVNLTVLTQLSTAHNIGFKSFFKWHFFLILTRMNDLLVHIRQCSVAMLEFLCCSLNSNHRNWYTKWKANFYVQLYVKFPDGTTGSRVHLLCGQLFCLRMPVPLDSSLMTTNFQIYTPRVLFFSNLNTVF